MSKLSVRIKLTDERGGVPFDQLGRVATESDKFLRMLSEDLQVTEATPQWRAISSEPGSYIVSAELDGEPPDVKATLFQRRLRQVCQFHPSNGSSVSNVRSATLAQYARIGQTLDTDQRVEFGFPSDTEDDDDERHVWLGLDRARSDEVLSHFNQSVSYYGSVQGVVHSWFKEASPPHFKLRVSASQELVDCRYPSSLYDQLVKLLEVRRRVIFVGGEIRARRENREIESIKVDRLAAAPEFSDEDFREMFGMCPDATGDLSTEQFLDEVRGR